MRIIDADALVDVITERCCKTCIKRMGTKNGKWRAVYEIGDAPCRACEVDDMKAELDDAPTIEAEPVRHGKWEVHEAFGYKDMTCSVCGWLYEYYGGLEEEWNYCPHCGAKMIPTIPKEIIDEVLGEDEVEE